MFFQLQRQSAIVYLTMLLKMIQYWYSRSHAHLYHLQNDICKIFAQSRQLIVEL